MDTIDKSKLTKQSRGHLCAIINTYGSGEHPFASEDSLGFFSTNYAVECLDTAWDQNNHEDRRRIINEIREELK
jgi:hypothetical protein